MASAGQSRVADMAHLAAGQSELSKLRVIGSKFALAVSKLAPLEEVTTIQTCCWESTVLSLLLDGITLIDVAGAWLKTDLSKFLSLVANDQHP